MERILIRIHLSTWTEILLNEAPGGRDLSGDSTLQMHAGWRFKGVGDGCAVLCQPNCLGPLFREVGLWFVKDPARPAYGMAVDHRDRIWFVETGPATNRFVGFDPATQDFISVTPIPSRAGAVRHMYFHPPERAVWFGTDTNNIGRVIVPDS